MPAFLGTLLVFGLGILSIVLFGIWGFPFTLIIAAAFIAYLLIARAKGDSVMSIERGRRHEPTGMPRPAVSDVETSNQRIGQD